MKRARVQKGSVVFNKRFGTWNFLWFEDGSRKSRKLGSLTELPTRQAAEKKADVLKRELGFEPQDPASLVRTLVEQYQVEKMSARQETRRVCILWFKKHILPRWGDHPITDLQPRPVELWLSTLQLAPKTRSHIRGLMFAIWKYAMWSGAVPVQANPIALVSVKGASKRTRQPRSLTVEQFHRLVRHLREPFKTMAVLAVCLGLRISELLALRWEDVDWFGGTLRVERGIVNRVIDDVKTENSRKSMTLDRELLNVLQAWKQTSQFQSDSDWMFPSPIKLGRLPYSYTGVWRELQRAGVEAGIGRLGTHTFRHTYRSWLDAVGTAIAVQQKLMRHSDIRTTMNVYGAVVTDEMAQASSRVAGLALKAVN